MFQLPRDDLQDNEKAACVLLSPRLQLQLDPKSEDKDSALSTKQGFHFNHLSAVVNTARHCLQTLHDWAIVLSTLEFQDFRAKSWFSSC